MKIKDIIFEPHNDMSAEDAAIVTEHDDLVRQNNYDDAAALLNNSNYKKGFRASLFNSIQNKIRSLEIYLLNEYAADSDEFYSIGEPSPEQMEGKHFWIQIYE